MAGFEAVGSSIFILGIMMLIGYIAEKAHYVSDIPGKTSKLIKNITLPLLILTSISSQRLSRDFAKNVALVIIFALSAILVLLLIGKITAKLFRLEGTKEKVHICLTAFGNVIFMAYPVISAVYGDEGLAYAVFYALVNDCFVWTYGVYVISEGGGGKSWQKLINPNTVAFTVGLIMLLSGLSLPELMHRALSQIGSVTTPVSMLFIGATLAAIDVHEIYKRASIYVIAAVKMVLAPIACIFVMKLLSVHFGLNFEEAVKGAVILQIAMPVQTIFAVLAKEYNADSTYAAETIFITTVLSLFTLPLIYNMLLQIK